MKCRACGSKKVKTDPNKPFMLHNVDARKIADHRNNIRGCYEKELICKLRGNSEAAEIWDAAPSESRTLFGDDNYKWYHRNHDSVYERWR